MARLNDDWQNLDVAIKAFDDMIEEQRSAIRSSVEGEVRPRIGLLACLHLSRTHRVSCMQEESLRASVRVRVAGLELPRGRGPSVYA